MWREEDKAMAFLLIGFGHQDLVNMVGYFDSDRLFSPYLTIREVVP